MEFCRERRGLGWYGRIGSEVMFMRNWWIGCYVAVGIWVLAGAVVGETPDSGKGAATRRVGVGAAVAGKGLVEVVYLQVFKPVKPEERGLILGHHAAVFGDVQPGLKIAVRVSVADMALTGV